MRNKAKGINSSARSIFGRAVVDNSETVNNIVNNYYGFDADAMRLMLGDVVAELSQRSQSNGDDTNIRVRNTEEKVSRMYDRMLSETQEVKTEAYETEIEESEDIPAKATSSFNICPRCGNSNSLNGKYCSRCGAQLKVPTEAVECPKCHTRNSSLANFCRNCSATLKAGSQTKICPICGREIDAEEDICVCGYSFVSMQQTENNTKIATSSFNICPRCGNLNSLNATHCSRCGAALLTVITAEEKFAKGNAFYDQGYYVNAAFWYRKAAAQGHAGAQCNLGGCYYYGKGVEQNYTEAVKWYRKAAEQGNVVAQYNLGFCYYFGQGVEQNYVEAVKWNRKAAEQGLASAQCNLGSCYYFGQGVKQNYVEAVKWNRKAAEQGLAFAQCNLGTCYYYGQGVEQNYVEAVKWYRKAAEQELAGAQYGLGICYYYGQGVEQNYNEATRWMRRAADQGNLVARQWLKDNNL